MAPFKRHDRPNEGYRIWPTLPRPWGRVGPWQTGMRSLREAERVEGWIRETAVLRPELVDALVDGRASLREAWIAKLRGEDYLADLIAGFEDQPLHNAIEAFRARCKDNVIRFGLNQLSDLTPPGVRVSWLRESPPARGGKPPRNLSRLYERAMEEGMKPSSVQRMLHGAVKKLLVHELGEEEARSRIVGVVLPKPDDERKVRIDPADIRRLLEAIEEDRFRWMVLIAILTTADRGPLLRARVRDFNEADATLELHDRKNDHRARIVHLASPALQTLRLAVAGYEPGDRIFPWRDPQARYKWQVARDKAAGRPDAHARNRGVLDPVGDEANRILEDTRVVTLPILRFKDLRYLLPSTLAALKVDRKEIKELLGHAPGSTVTDRYITASGDIPTLDEAAARLGLGAALKAV